MSNSADELEWQTRRERINTKLSSPPQRWEIVRLKEELNPRDLQHHAHQSTCLQSLNKKKLFAVSPRCLFLPTRLKSDTPKPRRKWTSSHSLSSPKPSEANLCLKTRTMNRLLRFWSASASPIRLKALQWAISRDNRSKANRAKIVK